MKKARAILSALTVLTVVGGALAFKAKDFNGSVLFTDSDNDNVCDTRLSLTKYTITDIEHGSATFATFVDEQPCANITVTVDNQ